MRKIRYISFFAVAVLVLGTTVLAVDLKPAEIISRHLDSIGTKEKRDSVKTLMAIGASEFESMTPRVRGGGRAIVVSDPDNLYFLIKFNSKEYEYERIGYFRGKLDIPFATPGMRSLLGAFIADHEKVLSDGLFGGTMSLRWPVLDTVKPRGKVTGGGEKKVGDKKAYALDFNVSGGGSSEFTIRMYFDTETFRHIRTEYAYVVEPKDAVFGQQNRRAAGFIKVTETFGDFRDVEGLMLPHNYRAELETNGNTGAVRTSWNINVEQWRVNQKLTPDFFTFDTK